MRRFLVELEISYERSYEIGPNMRKFEAIWFFEDKNKIQNLLDFVLFRENSVDFRNCPSRPLFVSEL